MASPRLLVLLFLAALFFMLPCITSSAEENALWPRPRHVSLLPQHRNRRASPTMSDETKEKIKSSVAVATSVLQVVADTLSQPGVKETLSTIASFVSLAPGIGTLIAAVINLALAFVPGSDPMAEVKKQFRVIDQKLDSISKQIADLQTDVEWQSFASTYSQDEMKIRDSWTKFQELRQICSSDSDCDKKKNELAYQFVTFYENTATEHSVSNLLFYLTNTDTSFSRNLLTLVAKKVKCDIKELGRYTSFFNSLLLKGMILNQLYYKLRGYNMDGKEAEYASKFMQVTEAQKNLVISCADSEEYIEPAVKEISKSKPLQVNDESAKRVKEMLDKTYDSYYWIVVIFDSKHKDDYLLWQFTLVDLGMIIVAVGRSNSKQDGETLKPFRQSVPSLLENKECSRLGNDLTQANDPDDIMNHLKGILAALHVRNPKKFSAVPEPFFSGKCHKSRFKKDSPFFFYAKLPHKPNAPWDPCRNHNCKNDGSCRWLAGTLTVCECKRGYYGDTCEKHVSVTTKDIEVVLSKPIPSIIGIDEKLTRLETQLTHVNAKLIEVDEQLRTASRKLTNMNLKLTSMDTKFEEISSNMKDNSGQQGNSNG